MPIYALTCGHEAIISFNRFDALKELGWPKSTCPHECVDSRPNSANLATFYGAWRISDPAFRDAEEATGEKIRSTKDIDRLEKAGVIRAVTNPSRSRKFKEKR